jgi:Zn-dependent peptidase ImmA (M78 family)/DNA-binding XRE family transcriptional regulator
MAKKLNTKIDRYLSWEDGKDQPTFKQAQKLASVVHVPFGYFFLREPPTEDLPIPDLRRVGGTPLGKPSPELIETVRSVMAKQEWFKDYLLENGAEPLEFVGRFNFQEVDPSVIVEDICSVLEINNAPDFRKGDSDAYLSRLIKACEEKRILVMRSGIVGTNTHRKLNVSEFRGFAIADRFAPLVFINSADARTARLFTLIHELAHLWIGSSGVSSAEPDDQREEAFCNQVAGEFLVPKDEFDELWGDDVSMNINFVNLSSHFHVSTLVIARRALQFSRISKASYQDFYKAELERFKNQGGGGNFYRNSTARNSSVFARAVIREALRSKMLLRDAGKLLDISPSKIKDYYAELS